MKTTLSTVLTLSVLAVAGCSTPARLSADPVANPPVSTPAPALVTPADWFAAQPKPVYKPGNTMPRLTRYGWELDVPAEKELAEHWNYCIQLGYLSQAAVDLAFNDPKSFQGQRVALTLSNPKKYPLAVIVDRSEPADQVDEAFLHDADGKLLNDQKVYSPIAPQIALDKMAELRADPLRELRKKVPITIILNGGEYGLGIPGFIRDMLEKDPKLKAARGDQDLFAFVSEAKGRETTTIADAVRAAVPDRQLYIYYSSGNTHRNRYGDWWQWGYDGKYMIDAGDLASNEFYYKHFNNGYLPGNDMLTQALNAVGYQIPMGQKNSYDWVTSGWVNGATEDAGLTAAVAAPVAALTNGGQAAPKLQGDNVAALVDPNAGELSPMNMYTGFLKCLFTTGTLGGNAGYYDLPTGGFTALFPADKPRQWAQQMARLTHVQALFSYVEDDLREGDLLPGANWTAAELDRSKDGWPGESPYKGKYFPINGHPFSHDQPAYELPTVANDYPGVRVLARKTVANKSTRWLVTAWAADGVARPVKVMIPELGEITLLARPEGSVYRVTLQDGKPQLEWLDPDGMTPTVNGFTPQKVTTEQIKAAWKAPSQPVQENLQLQFDAAQGVEKDADNAVLAWKPSGALPDWTLQAPPKDGNALWVADAVNGLPAIRLDGKRLGLVTQSLADKGVIAAGPVTVFAVYASSVPFSTGNMLGTAVGPSFINRAAPVAGAQTWQLRDEQINLAKSPPYLSLGSAVSENGELEAQWLFGGDIAELLVYEGVLSLAQQVRVRLYLQAKYRL